MDHRIIGTGRWGSWLARRLAAKKFKVVSVCNRNQNSAVALAKEIGSTAISIDDLCEEDLSNSVVWLGVPDDSIYQLHTMLSGIQKPPRAIVHASGSAKLVDQGCLSAALWPVQSITKNQEPIWKQLQFVYQCEDSAFAKTLAGWAKKIAGLSPKQVTSDQDRKLLHLGAVMTQNFSNSMFQDIESTLREHKLDFRLLLPLMHTYLNKLESISPENLQTGPAIRGDIATVNAHLSLLQNSPQTQELYRLFSLRINPSLQISGAKSAEKKQP